MSTPFQATITFLGDNHQFTVLGEGTFHPGRYGSAPEDCYEDFIEAEIREIRLDGELIFSATLPFDMCTQSDYQECQWRLEDEVARLYREARSELLNYDSVRLTPLDDIDY